MISRKRMREGEVVRALLVGSTEHGLEIEFDGLKGFVQPIEISWDPRVGPTEVGRVGDELDVLVYAIIADRFYGSIKRARPDLDPWRDPERFRVGSVHHGTVTAVVDWGAVVSIGPGVNGMVVARDLPMRVHVGANLDVEVVGCDPGSRKLEFAIEHDEP